MLGRIGNQSLAPHCTWCISSTWDCNEANTSTSTIDHLQWIHLQRYYVDGGVVERLSSPQCCSGVLFFLSFFLSFFFFCFYSPSRIICESHIRDVFRQAEHVVFSFEKKKQKTEKTKQKKGKLWLCKWREREREREEEKRRSGKASLSLLLIYQTKSPGSLRAINLTRQKVWQLGALTTHLRLLTLPRIKCSQEAARNTGHSD